MKPYFIGLGAQRSGTSWVYANLDAHPEICIPVKEIHFFSREKNFVRGIDWYEGFFRRCGRGKKCGEFSTSYLYSETAAQRIARHYSEVKLVAVLRNPVERAFSNFINDLMAGEVRKGTDFLDALKEHSEYVDQGVYPGQIKRCLDCFPRESLLIVIYEDIKKDPLTFMRHIYRFLEVDTGFVSPMLHERVNPSYVPRNQKWEKSLNRIASSLRRRGGGRLTKVLKKTGIPKVVRAASRESALELPELTPDQRKSLFLGFEESIENLEKLIGRKLPEWKI